MLGNKSSLLTLLLLPSLVLANNIWTVTLGGGDVRFRGVIIAESCRVEAGDKHMIVDMGQISSNRFHHVGEDVNPVPFNIHLQECNTAVSDRASVTFHGIADEKYPEVLSIGDKQDSAKGVSIALFDNEDRLIPLNSTPIKWNRLYKGPNTLNFVAKYRATSNEVTGGIAKAHAWFALTYQ